MEVIVLGSGTNVPSERACAGYLVRTDTPFIVDMGHGTFSNLCKAADRSDIGTIIFSHPHADHYGDFIAFFQNAIHESKDKKRKDLDVIAPKGMKGIIDSMLSFPGLAEGRFKTAVRETSGETFSIGKAKIISKEVRHVDSLHCNGYRIEHRGKALAYSGDSRLCDEVVALCKNADVAILDCSVPKGFPKGHHLGRNHLGVLGCGEVARRANVKKLVLSHIYPACDGHNLVKECREVFDGDVIVARDLMTINV